LRIKERAEADAKINESFKALAEREAKYKLEEEKRIAKIADEKERNYALMKQ